jgi:hypothetical protein
MAEQISMTIFLLFLILSGFIMLKEAVNTGPHPHIDGSARWFDVGIIWFAALLGYGAAIALALKIGLNA